MKKKKKKRIELTFLKIEEKRANNILIFYYLKTEL